ncbi:MAG: hypothetical protein WCC17_24615 [Candidatus Nitrosopolaris sp.]
MRVNIDLDEHIVATLPKVWGNQVGFMGLFKKTKEGILALTNKKVIFIPEWVFVTQKERVKKYFSEDQAKITRIDGYSEAQLDEDITKYSKSVLVSLEYVISVENVELRKVNFLRIKFNAKDKTRIYDFGLAKTLTNYPVRQPLQYYSLDWSAWIKMIKAYLPTQV